MNQLCVCSLYLPEYVGHSKLDCSANSQGSCFKMGVSTEISIFLLSDVFILIVGKKRIAL